MKPVDNDNTYHDAGLSLNREELTYLSNSEVPNSMANDNEEVSHKKSYCIEDAKGDEQEDTEVHELSRTGMDKENQVILALGNDDGDSDKDSGGENSVFDVEAHDKACNGHDDTGERIETGVVRPHIDIRNSDNVSSLTPTTATDDDVKFEMKRNEEVVYNADIKSEESIQNGEQGDHPFDITDVLNVEIALQEPSKSILAGEPCKKVEGEAVERTHCRTQSNSGCLFVDQEDSIESNIHWIDEDDERIDLECSPLHSPVGSEHSLFPAPQMNYPSIYSQDTVSLSEISLSEPEHDVTVTDKHINHIEYTDSLAMLSFDSNDLTDIEDTRRHSPPINLDSDGGVELTDASFLHHKFIDGSSRVSAKGSDCSSPSAVEIHTPPPMSPQSMAEKVSERLRFLADSWADIPLPASGLVQSIAVTDTLVWCVDNHEHVFVTQSSSADIHWKKVDGRLRTIASNQSGTIVWGVNRKKFALCRKNVNNSRPQGKSSLCYSVFLHEKKALVTMVAKIVLNALQICSIYSPWLPLSPKQCCVTMKCVSYQFQVV